MSEDCATCCTVLSSLGIVLLLLFGWMFQQGAVTFQLLCIKNGWEMEQKANACFGGAMLYGASLFLSVFYKIYKRKQAAAAEAAAANRK